MKGFLEQRDNTTATDMYQAARLVAEEQQAYRDTQKDDHLLGMYTNSVFMAERFLRKITTTHPLPTSDIHELACDYGAVLVERTLKKPSFRLTKEGTYRYVRKSVYSVLKGSEARHITGEMSLHDIADEAKDPQKIALSRSLVLDCLDTIRDILGEDKLPLFLLWIEGRVKYVGGLSSDMDALKMEVCRHLLESRCRYVYFEFLPSFEEAHLSSAVFLSFLMEEDPSLAYIPVLIGEKPFTTLLTAYAGRTIQFPDMNRLKKAYDLARRISLGEHMVNQNMNLDMVSRMVEHAGALSSSGMDFEKLPVPQEGSEASVSYSVLLPYFQSIFDRIQGLLGRVEDSVKELDLEKNPSGLAIVCKDFERLVKIQTALLGSVGMVNGVRCER